MSTFLTAKPIERSDCVRDGGDLLCAHQRTVCIIRLLYLIYYDQGTIISQCWWRVSKCHFIKDRLTHSRQPTRLSACAVWRKRPWPRFRLPRPGQRCNAALYAAFWAGLLGPGDCAAEVSAASHECLIGAPLEAMQENAGVGSYHQLPAHT